MKSLLKILAIALASSLLCLACTALWIQSLFAADIYLNYYPITDRRVSVECYRGELALGIENDPITGEFQETGYVERLSVSRADMFFHGEMSLWNRLGFGYDFDDFTLDSTNGSPPLRQVSRQWVAPLWLFMILFGLPPVWLWNSSRRRKRRLSTRGICIYCGYDLRATPNRCPECGKIPPSAAGNPIR